MACLDANNVVCTASRISPRSPCEFQFAEFRLFESYSGTPVPNSLSQQDSMIILFPVLFRSSDSRGFCSNFASIP